MNDEIELYGKLLNDIKIRVRTAQIKATLSANAEMLAMYFDIGAMIYKQQQQYGWRAKITRKLALDIKNELPKEKGFSQRNLEFMVQFYNEYKQKAVIGKQPVSQIEPIPKQAVSEFPQKTKQLVSQIPWGHNILLMQVDDLLKHPTDQSTIGLILCQSRNKIFAEYALKDINKPIGVSEYELTQALPDSLKSSLPSIEELEAKLSENII